MKKCDPKNVTERPKNWGSHCDLPEMQQLSDDAEAIRQDFDRYLTNHLGRYVGCPTIYKFQALSMALRDRMMPNWRCTWMTHKKESEKRAYYLSMEYLMGRTLGNAMLNSGVTEQTQQMLQELCLKVEEIEDAEPDAGLGNGGLGRLAACFMDSCATLGLPMMGYGLRYHYGMFQQAIKDGYQVEKPDNWLRNENPWELERPEYTVRVKFGGYVHKYTDKNGQFMVEWANTNDVLAIPFDVPIPGFNNGVVNTLRLWQSAASKEFNLNEFNKGDYAEAVASKNHAEDITMVLYPNDSSENGKELRLRQQYFLASASLQDIIRHWEEDNTSFDDFGKNNVIQLNDTHPTISVAELMRILIDEKGLEWNKAWDITTNTFAYTNHTLLPEALERWSVSLFERLLPRPLEIIYEINARFMRQVALKWPGDSHRMQRLSIIEEGPTKMVRMANLAIVGSFSVNGVAALHSDLLKTDLFHDFYELWPHKFNNKTNGVTQRRWMAYANPGLRKLLAQTIGENWITNLGCLEDLKPYAIKDDKKFAEAWQKVKLENKARLAELVKKDCKVEFETDALFDVQVKRIHEYKRQLLNILHVIHLYDRIKRGDTANWTKRCVLIGGKAAPGYYMAKRIIKLANAVADVVNNDPDVGNKLKIAFLPNYRVTAMEIIAPGTDLSEQISTAGKEASGTGNMKFMMNGALTIGTYDGANIEIMDAVGEENFYLFGLRENEVKELRHHYNPQSIVDGDDDLKRVMWLLGSGLFNQFEPGIFDDIINSVMSPHDPWMTLADFRSYVNAQQKVSKDYQDQDRWTKMSILNTASSGFFSTDRTMQEYNRDIWKLEPITLI